MTTDQAQSNYAQGVSFLVFELDGQFYGVNVDQVEEIVTEERCDELSAHQEQDVPTCGLARWVGLDQPEAVTSRVLLSRGSGELEGFLVDTPKNIVTLSLEDISPMPCLIRQVLGPSPLWGVGRMSRGLLLLVDLHRRPTP